MADNRNDLIQIGVTLRQLRLAQGKTLDDIADTTGLSKSLISKIENFRTIPSLPVLANICKALKTDMADLVQGIGINQQDPYVVVRADQRRSISRDEGEGYLYENILNSSINATLFDSFVLTIDAGSKRSVVTTDGMQFIFILEGQIEFRVGDDVVPLDAGDSLYFDGRIPHLPVNRKKKPAKLLAIYLLKT
ncbi:MAG: cupin domain-containing protein [Planctomycetes bacterium]|jgi:transcriptional regulator with XRE-family HTH domain|nr:cupin domain-containing protein [Planctomycetota bacterium]